MDRSKNIKALIKANKKPKVKNDLKNSQDSIIDIKNVDKYYVVGNQSEYILKKVNLSIKRGGLVVIFGPSGSGKSTFLNIISGLDRATYGHVIVNDVNLSTLNDSQLTTFRRETVGFIFQSYNLLPDLNAHDNVKMGQVLQKDKEKVIDITTLFEDLGIAKQISSNIKNLSGGQQQRVSIARALAKNPEIIFADEPTGSLDQKTTTKVINLLKRINQKYNNTIIVVTHDPQWKDVATQILHVNDGEITDDQIIA